MKCRQLVPGGKHKGFLAVCGKKVPSRYVEAHRAYHKRAMPVRRPSSKKKAKTSELEQLVSGGQDFHLEF